MEGNAVEHLMPPPFYAYRWVVAKARAPEESIQEMIDSIVDASADKRYKIEVMPGVYIEQYGDTTTGVNMKEYVDVVAPYGRVIIRPDSSVSTAVNMADNCMLQGLEVDMQNMAATAIGVLFAAAVDHSYMEDVWVTGGGAADLGVDDETTGSTVIIRKCRIDEAATCYKKNGSGSTWFADNRLTSSSVDIDINAGTLNLMDNELMGDTPNANVDANGNLTVNSYHNTLNGTGWKLANHAGIKILSHDDVFTKVTFVGADGLFADLTGARLYSCVADAIAIGDWVYCDDDDHVALADADLIDHLPSIGRVTYLPTSTTCYVTNYGYAYDAASNSGHGDAWVAGKEFWISQTPGEIDDNMPPIWQQMAGVAVSTQRFKVILGSPGSDAWPHTNEYVTLQDAVAVDDWVYQTGTNDTVAKAQADSASTMEAIGIVVEIITSFLCRVRLRGKWTESNNDEVWVASNDVYISPITAGKITQTIPVDDIIQKVAEVKYYSAPTLTYEMSD